MTRFTNNNKLSLPIAVWTLMDNYNYDERENVISATTLLKPVRQICLGMKFKDNLKVIDASDLINSSMGTALHDSVEKAWKNEEKTKAILRELGYSEALYDEVVLERRSEKEINGYIISGQFDIAFRGTVCDIKSTSTYKFIFTEKETKEWNRIISMTEEECKKELLSIEEARTLLIKEENLEF